MKKTEEKTIEEQNFDLEAEQVVLGCIFLEPNTFNKLTINHTYFCDQNNKTIFLIMESLDLIGEPIDLITVTEKLAEFKLLDRIGGIKYLSDLAGTAPTATKIKHYESKIKRHAMKKMAIDICTNAVEVANNINPDKDSEEEIKRRLSNAVKGIEKILNDKK